MINNIFQNAYLNNIVDVANEYLSVREVPRNSNLGPQVEEFQRSVGEHAVGGAWCSCFVYYICLQVANSMKLDTKVKKTARAMAHWYYAPDSDLEWLDVKDASKVRPGMMFVQIANENRLLDARRRDIEKASGHIGFVTSTVDEAGWFSSVEGNTNPGGSREGGGVYARRRHISENIVGFVEPGFNYRVNNEG